MIKISDFKLRCWDFFFIRRHTDYWRSGFLHWAYLYTVPNRPVPILSINFNCSNGISHSFNVTESCKHKENNSIRLYNQYSLGEEAYDVKYIIYILHRLSLNHILCVVFLIMFSHMYINIHSTEQRMSVIVRFVVTVCEMCHQTLLWHVAVYTMFVACVAVHTMFVACHHTYYVCSVSS